MIRYNKIIVKITNFNHFNNNQIRKNKVLILLKKESKNYKEIQRIDQINIKVIKNNKNILKNKINHLVIK